VEKMGMPSSSTILSPLSRDRGDDKATRKMLQMAMFFRTLVGQRCSEHMGMASGKDGDGQWKRWGWSMEKMGMVNGKDGDGQWKRWGWPVEKMGMVNGI
jgi:hypothetical protein